MSAFGEKGIEVVDGSIFLSSHPVHYAFISVLWLFAVPFVYIFRHSCLFLTNFIIFQGYLGIPSLGQV